MQTPQILEEYIWVIGRDTPHDSHLPKFSGVLLHILPLPFIKVIPMDPLVLYIPDRLKMRLNEGF
jgi:hypothetical protein